MNTQNLHLRDRSRQLYARLMRGRLPSFVFMRHRGVRPLPVNNGSSHTTIGTTEEKGGHERGRNGLDTRQHLGDVICAHVAVADDARHSCCADGNRACNGARASQESRSERGDSTRPSSGARSDHRDISPSFDVSCAGLLIVDSWPLCIACLARSDVFKANQLRPDRFPGLLTKHLASQLTTGLALDPTRLTWVHVSAASEALVEILFMGPHQQGQLTTALGRNCFAHVSIVA